MAGTLTTMQMMEIALGQLERALVNDGSREKMCFLEPVAGNEVALDYGPENVDCDAGMGWVRLVDKSFGYDFSGQISESACDDGAQILTLEIGVVRPATALFDVNGGQYRLPEPSEHRDDTARQMADMDIMEWAIRSLKDMDEGPDFRVMFGQYVPIGPDGGVIGGLWNFSVMEDI